MIEVLAVLAATFTLRLHDAVVEDAVVFLPEVARIEGASAAEEEVLSGVEVTRGIAPGRSRTVAADVLRMRLHAAGFPPDAFRLAGPTRITVERAGQEVEPARLEAVLREAIEAELAAGDLLEIGHLPARLPTFPAGSLAISVDTGGDLVRGRSVWVEISAGEVSHRFPVPYRIRRLRPVAVAAKRIERGERISPEAVRFEVREVGHLYDPVFDVTDIAGRTAKQPILAGTTLTRAAFEVPPLVRAGAPVSVIARTGGVEVTVEGEARQNGHMGDVIRVFVPTAHRTLPARVTGRAEAAVLE